MALPVYVTARLCLLRRLGVRTVMHMIDAFRLPRYSRSALAPSLAVVQAMSFGGDTGGPWVGWHHLHCGTDALEVGHFTLRQCPQCHRLVRFCHVHGPSSLLFHEPCTCDA